MNKESTTKESKTNKELMMKSNQEKMDGKMAVLNHQKALMETT